MNRGFVAVERSACHVGFLGVGIERRPSGVWFVAADDRGSGDDRSERSIGDVLRRPGRLLFVGGRRLSVAEVVAGLDEVDPTWNLIWIDGAGAATGLTVRWEAPDAPSSDGGGGGGDSTVRGTLSGGRLTAGPGLALTPADGSSVELVMPDEPDADADSEPDPASESELVPPDPPFLRFVGPMDFTVPGASVRAAAMTLTMLGPDAGTFRWSGVLDAGARATINHLDRGVEVSATAFDLPAGPVDVRFDPAAPVDPERTAIELGADRSLVAGWSDRSGRPVRLRTAAGSAVVPQPTAAGEVALAPAGPFETIEAVDLVCGRSGAEFLRLAADQPLDFRPGHPSGRSGDRLPTRPTTSWVASSADRVVPYFTQPTSDPLHRAEADFLAPVDVSIGALTGNSPVPMMPWLGWDAPEPTADTDTDTGSASASANAVEARLVMIRADRIPAEPHPDERAPDAVSIPAVTGSGLRVGLDEHRPLWLELLRVGPQTARVDVVHHPRLQAALVADRPFLVLTQPPKTTSAEPAAETTDDGDQPPTLLVDGWALSFDPDDWARHGTAVIIKQRTDRSVADLIGEPDAWTAATPHGDAASTSARLRAWIDATREADDGAKRDLVDRVLDDPDWQGVLFVSVPAPLSSLPDDLAPLRAGLPDGGVVLAHHLVVDRRSLVDDTTDAAVSGLIEYPAPGRNAAPGVRANGFGFTTRSLRVRLVDARVVDLGAAVSVTVPSVLGMALADPIELALEGRRVDRAGGTGYSFRTVFDPPVTAAARDAVVASIELTGADLVMGGGLRAVFDGSLAFTEVVTEEQPAEGPRLDLVGYRSLQFAGLALSLPEPEPEPSGEGEGDGERSPGPFSWSTDDLSLVGKPDGDSLAARFPVTPVGLIHGTDENRADLGYLPVRPPAGWPVPTTDGPFVGIEHRLDLGSVGSLAADAPLSAHLAVSWTPGTAERHPHLGFRFPAADVGAFGFSLQDVLSLAVHGIELQHRGDDGGGDAWGLVLRGVALDLLSLKIPWAGSIDAFLTPGPGGADGRPVMGWSARYPGPDPDG